MMFILSFIYYCVLIALLLGCEKANAIVTKTSNVGCVSATIPTGNPVFVVNLGARGTLSILENSDQLDFNRVNVKLELNIRGGIECQAFAVNINLKGTTEIQAKVPHSMHTFADAAVYTLKDFCDDLITNSKVYQKIAGNSESGRAIRGKELVKKWKKLERLQITDREEGDPTDEKVIQEETFKQGLILAKEFGAEVHNAVLSYFSKPMVNFDGFQKQCLKSSQTETDLAEIQAAEREARPKGLFKRMGNVLQAKSGDVRENEETLRQHRNVLKGIEDAIHTSMPPATVDGLIHAAIKMSFYKVFLGSRNAAKQLNNFWHTFHCTQDIPKPTDHAFEKKMRYQAQMRICEFAKKGFAEERGSSANTDANIQRLVSQIMVFPHEFKDESHTQFRTDAHDAQVMESSEGIDLIKDMPTAEEYMATYGTASGKCVSKARELYNSYIQRIRDLTSSVSNDAKQFVTLLRISDSAAYSNEWECVPPEAQQQAMLRGAKKACGGDTGEHKECAARHRREAKIRNCQKCTPKDSDDERECDAVSSDGTLSLSFFLSLPLPLPHSLRLSILSLSPLRSYMAGTCQSHCELLPISRLDFSEAWKRVIRAFDGKAKPDEMTPEELEEHNKEKTEDEETQYRAKLEEQRVDRVIEVMNDPNVNWVLRRSTSNNDALDYVGWMRLLSYNAQNLARMFPDVAVRNKYG